MLDRLLKLIALRPRSEKEIRDWFARKKVDEHLQKELLGELKRLELVDDKKFAQWWIEQRISFRPKGRRLLKLELLEKGVDKTLTNELLDELLGTDVQINCAKNILNKKITRWKGLASEGKYQKAMSFLMRRGFDFSLIKKVFDELDVKR